MRIFILLFALTIMVSAQTGTVRGFVADSTNGEALAFANVIIEGTTLGAATDIHGYYIIPLIKSGKQLLKISIVGFEPRVIPITVVANKITQINVNLMPMSIELQELIIIGEKTVKQNETNVGLQTISAKQVEMLPRGLEADVLRTLQYTPGVRSTGDVTGRYYVRGSRSDQNLITLNGATVYNPYHALGIFSVIDPEIVNVMEFYKGGFTSQFGGRLSSVLNIVTRDGNKKHYEAAGAMSLLSGKFAIEGPIPNGSLMVTGRKSFFENSMNDFINKKETPFEFYDLSFKVNYSNPEVLENGKFTVHGFISNDAVANKNPNKEDYTFVNSIFGVNWYQVWASPLYSTMSFSLSKFDAEVLPNKSRSKPRRNEISDFSSSWDFTYMYDSKDELGIGFQFKILSTLLNQESLRGGTTELDQTGLDMGFYIKYKFMRFETLGIDLGTRVNLTNAAKHVASFLEPRVSVTYAPYESFRIKGAFGIYTQSLFTLSDENDLISIFEPWILTPDYIQPAKAVHYISGLEYFLTSQLSVQLEGYYKDIQNQPDLNPDKFTAEDPDFISATGESYGFEASTKFQSSSVFATIGYSLSWAFMDNKGFRYAPRYDARHTVNILAGLSIGLGIELNANWSFSTGMPFTPIAGYYDRVIFDDVWTPDPVNNEYLAVTYYGSRNSKRLPVYHRLDMGLSKKFDFGFARFTFDASVINLYDRENIFYFDKDTGERVNMLPIFPSVNVKVEI